MADVTDDWEAVATIEELAKHDEVEGLAACMFGDQGLRCQCWRRLIKCRRRFDR